MSDIISEPKKVLPLLILDILKRCTNEENTLTQKEISDIFMREFGVKADRKTIFHLSHSLPPWTALFPMTH